MPFAVEELEVDSTTIDYNYYFQTKKVQKQLEKYIDINNDLIFDNSEFTLYP